MPYLQTGINVERLPGGASQSSQMLYPGMPATSGLVLLGGQAQVQQVWTGVDEVGLWTVSSQA